MKLAPRDLPRWRHAPPPDMPAALIHGGDAVRVAQVRADVVAALTGPDADRDMRLARLTAAELRKDGAALIDAVTATGFFPGPRAVVVSDAGDGLAPLFAAALDTWRPGDAHIIATAGQLPPRGKLRKLFEGHGAALAVPVYDDPPGRAEIEAMLSRAGLGAVDRDAMQTLGALAASLPAGDLAQTIEKAALFKIGDPSPLTAPEIAALAPQSGEAAVDDILNSVADGKAAEVGTWMQRLSAQGVNPTTLCIGATRHFRGLHAIAADPGGPAAGAGRLRPPVFGPRRDRMIRQARGWGVRKLESALSILIDTDLQLRSSSAAPQAAVIERALIRLAMLGRT